MNPNEPADNTLNVRLASLESELRALRQRIVVLEKLIQPPVREPASAMEVQAPAIPPAVPAAAVQPVAHAEAIAATPPPIPAAGMPRVAEQANAVEAAAQAPETPRVAQSSLPPPPIPKGPSSFSKFLHTVHLLPPSGSGSGEVQLGAWWATRIGALLVVLAVVFFGVYVSLGTPPWVKLIELAAVSAGVALAGRWLEKRIGRFGSVILGGGLALIFFSAFAAYAIPAVKVTDNLAIAACLQAAAVAFVFGVAVRRGSQTVATMATLLGFVSAFFSIAEGFDDFAVFGALALACVSVGLRRWRGWAPPMVFAVVLTHAILAVVAISIWDTEVGRRSIPFVFGVAASAFAVFLLSIIIEGPDEAGAFARAQRWLQTLNGSLGAVAGLVAATTVLERDDLSWYFFAAGAVLLLSAVWAWRVAPRDSLMAAFAVKASALIAMGVMTEFDARTRWMVLLVEAFVLYAASLRTGKRILAVVAATVWVLSLAFHLNDSSIGGGGWISFGGAAVALYVVASPVLLGLVQRIVSTERISPGVAVILGLAASVVAWRTCTMIIGEAWAPVAMIGVVCCLGGASRLLRSIVPVVVAVVVFGWAHAALHTYSLWQHGSVWLWFSAFAVAAVGTAGAWWAIERWTDADEKGLGKLRQFSGVLLAALAVTALAAAAFKFWPDRVGLAISIGLCAGTTWFGARSGRSQWQWSGVVAGFATFALSMLHAVGSFEARGSVWWLWAAAIGGVLLLTGSRHETADTESAGTREGALPWFAALLAVILLWVATEETFGVVGRGWMSVAAIIGFALIARALPLVAAWGAASLFPAIGLLSIVTSVPWPPVETGWAALASAWSAGVVFGLLPAIAVRLAPWISGSVVNGWRVLHLVIGALFLLSVTLARPAPWASLTTVVWALAGIAWFVAGLFCRARSHRVAGLLMMAICIPRVFFVDINSMTYRIAAFVVLGLVLLWVGFSYQRFRYLVDDGGAAATRPPEDTE